MAANSDQIEPMYLETVRDLEDSFRDMQPCFEGKEVEGNWSAREKNILKLRRITKGNAPLDFTVAYLIGIKLLLDGILKAVNSLRTTVSSNGCLLVQDIANAAGSGLDSMVDIILQSLIKLCANTKKITATNADVTVTVIVANVTYSARLAHHIWLACQDKNVQPRSFATGWIKAILHRHRHHKNILEHGGSLELIEKCLKAGLADRDMKVRESMRVTLWAFARLWPDRSEVVISALDDKYQKSILNDPANPIKNKAPAAPAESKAHPLSRSTTSVPKPTIRETIAAQKRAKLASKNLPERPGSAQSAAPLQPFSTLSGATRPATALASAMGTLSSAPVRPMRPTRRPEIKKAAIADPHSAKVTSKIAPNKLLDDNHHSPLSVKKNSQFGPKKAHAASAAKENVIPTVRRNERHALRETSPQSSTIASGAKIAAQKLTTSENGKPECDGFPMRGRSTSIKSTSGGARPTWSPPGSVKSTSGTPAGSRRTSVSLSELGGTTSKSPPKRESQTPPREEQEMATTLHRFEQETAPIPLEGEIKAAQIHNSAEQGLSQVLLEVEDETSQITHEADQGAAQVSQQKGPPTTQILPEVKHETPAQAQEETDQNHPQHEQVTVQISIEVEAEIAQIPTEMKKPSAGYIRANSVLKETNLKLRVYEDPSGEGLENIICPPSTRPSAKFNVLEELPINEPAAYHIGPLLAEETDKSGYHKDWKEQVKVEARSIGDKNDNPYLMRRILASGITRLRAGTLDVHGFRRLQGLIRDREDVWEEGVKFDELLELLLETLESPNRNDSIATNARAQDQLKAQVLMTIRLLLRRDVKYFSTYYPRALTALISARKYHIPTSHIVSGLEEVSEMIVEKCAPIECIDAVLDLLETDILRAYPTIYMALYALAGLLHRMYPNNRSVFHLTVPNIISPPSELEPEPDHHDQRRRQRQHSPSSASRTRRVRSTSPSKSRISHTQKVRLGKTAAHFLSDTNPEIRRAGVEFTLKLYDAVGEEGGFWNLMDTNSDQRNLITYYLLRRDRS